MKTRMLTAGLLLAVFTTTAMAEQNFVQKFLDRYRPPATVNAATISASAGSDQTLQDLIRDGALPLTPQDVIRLMIQSNLDVRVDRLSPIEQELLIDTLFRPFEPTLRLSANLNRNTRPTTSQLDGAANQTQLNHNYNVSFSQALQTGTSVGVALAMNRNSTNSAFSTFNPSYSGTLTYSVSQHLLRDFSRDINLHSIRVAKNNKAMSDVQFELALIDLVTQGQEMYWDLVGTREDIKVKQQSLTLAQKTLSDNQRQVQIGTLAQIDVIQTEANVAAREEQMVVSTYQNDQLQDQIKKLITGAGDPAFVLAKLNPVEAVHRPGPNDVMPIAEAIKYALESRPELRQLALQKQNNDLDLQYNKNQLLPVLDVFASYTQSGIGGNQLNPTSGQVIKPGGLGDAFSQMFGYNFTGYAAGFSVAIPLSNKSQRAQYSSVMLEKQTTEAKRAALAQTIALQVRNAYSVVEMNRVQITAAEKTKELAARQLDAEQKKFQLGSGQIRFVLEEQTNLTVAETNEIEALVGYAKALVEFDRAIGRTLQRNNIQLDKEANITVRDNKSAPGN